MPTDKEAALCQLFASASCIERTKNKILSYSKHFPLFCINRPVASLRLTPAVRCYARTPLRRLHLIGLAIRPRFKLAAPLVHVPQHLHSLRARSGATGARQASPPSADRAKNPIICGWSTMDGDGGANHVRDWAEMMDHILEVICCLSGPMCMSRMSYAVPDMHISLTRLAS